MKISENSIPQIAIRKNLFRNSLGLLILLLPFTVWCKNSNVDKCRAFEKAIKKASSAGEFSVPLKSLKFDEPNQLNNWVCASFGTLGGKPGDYGDIQDGMDFALSSWRDVRDAENECIDKNSKFEAKIGENMYRETIGEGLYWHTYFVCKGKSTFRIYFNPKDFPKGPDKKLIQIGLDNL